MKLVLLKTPDVPPIPPSIKVLADWGPLTIMPSQERGDHLLVEGDESALRGWLLNLNFWRGDGIPQMQHFVVSRFKEIK